MYLFTMPHNVSSHSVPPIGGPGHEPSCPASHHPPSLCTRMTRAILAKRLFPLRTIISFLRRETFHFLLIKKEFANNGASSVPQSFN